MFEIVGKYSTAKVMIDDVESSCVSQINGFVNHPAFTNPIAIMPDTHAGKGSVIGFTMKLTNKVVPNVVGVDIGCGMLSFVVGSSLSVTLEKLDDEIRQRIPFGADVHEDAVIHMRDKFPWAKANSLAEKFVQFYNEQFGILLHRELYDMNWFDKKCKQIGGERRRYIDSIGTLGGGNHFIETGISQNTKDYWITIHTGSRNFGLRVCDYWQRKANNILRVEKRAKLQERMIEIKQKFSGNDIQIQIEKAKKDLGLNEGISLVGCEWLEGADASNYLFDMIFAQVYASTNRHYIMNAICEILNLGTANTLETVHNFIDFNDFIIRKGSIRSYEHEKMIIPFNMRDGILLCEGKSNSEWNYSAPHGAGRIMSRGDAKRYCDMEKFRDDMKDIFSTSVTRNTLDECPDAYKDPMLIEQAIGPTATILDRIKPIHNMKDSSSSRKKDKKKHEQVIDDVDDNIVD